MSRKLYRHFFSEPLELDVSLTEIEGKKLKVPKKLNGKILNLSGGGVAVKSELDIPVKANMTFKIILDLMDEHLELEAFIVRKTESRYSSDFEYGFKFVIDSGVEDRIVGLVHKLEGASRQVN